MNRRGLTLIELMVVLVISMILVGSVAYAYQAGTRFQMLIPEADSELRVISESNERFRALFEGAYISADESDQTTYFLTLSSDGELAEPDTLVFTTLGTQPTLAYTRSQEDYETLNEVYGPQGGLTEVAISTVPVGEAPTNNALFIRNQRPADGDPTQGGFESVLLEGIETVSFEFFDGVEWVFEWNTLSESHRLPAAVRIVYTYSDDGEEYSVIVRLPHSDVTPENPVLQEVQG